MPNMSTRFADAPGETERKSSVWKKFEVIEFWRALRSATVICVFVTLGAAALFSGLNYTSAVTDDTRLREKVADAYGEGTLTSENRLLNDREVGALQSTDCLILAMALNAHGTGVERAVSPFGRPLKEGRETVENSALVETGCGRLMDRIVNDNDDSYGFAPYHRYIHGGRAVAELAVPRLGVQGYRDALLTANSLVLLLAAVITLVRASRPGAQTTERTTNLGLCLLSILLLTMSGVQYFGMSLAMGPADLFVHLMFLILVCIGAIRSRRNLYFAVIAVSAAFIIYFEFLTGQIPLSVALLIMLPCLFLTSDADVPEAVIRGIVGTFAFCLVCVALLIAKYIVTAVVFGPDVLSGITDQLDMRTSLEGFSWFEVFARLAYRTHHIAFGSTFLGITYFFLALGLFAHSFWRDLNSGQVNRRFRAFGLLAGALSILVWYLVFSSHSAIHSWFMIRPIGLFAAMACAYKILEMGSSATRQAETPVEGTR